MAEGTKRKPLFYDERCDDLAGVFLADEPKISSAAQRARLAHTIQVCIEDWIATEHADRAEAEAASQESK